VPMFHANAWGLPFSAVWVGAKMVLPGRFLDPKSLLDLMQQEKVTVSAGVPTIWMGILQLLDSGAAYDLRSLRKMVVGGSAAPRAMIEAFQKKYGIEILHAYGMTETSPLVLAANLKSYMEDFAEEEQYTYRAKQGVIVPGLDMRIIGPDGREVRNDGREMGELQLRGAWIAGGYYNDPERSAEAVKDGWLCTGDIATVDEEGYVQIMDRTKDLVKSGGEWISSVDLENELAACPGVLEAAVVAMPDARWQERPVAFVVPLQESGELDPDMLSAWLARRFAKWWIPDRFVVVAALPKTGVGKVDKRTLRQRAAGLAL